MKDNKIETFNQVLNDQAAVWGDYTPVGKEKELVTYIPEVKGWRLNWPEDRPLVIGTHPKTFHADDVLSCAMLAGIVDPKKITVIRSRDPQELERADILVDVGEGLFDHHGKRAADGISAASRVFLGIINNWIQLSWDGSWMLESAKHEYIAARFWDVVSRVAAWDTGNSDCQNPFPEIHVAAQYACACKPKEIDKIFMEEVDSVQTQLARMADRWVMEFNGLTEAEQIIKQGGSILSFPMECRFSPVKEMAYEAKSDAVFFVSPEDEEDWRILCCAPTDKEFSGFGSKQLIPERFRGLRGQELSEKTGIPGGIFCHQGGFIAGFKTRESAEAFARLCLK